MGQYQQKIEFKLSQLLPSDWECTYIYLKFDLLGRSTYTKNKAYAFKAVSSSKITPIIGK